MDIASAHAVIWLIVGFGLGLYSFYKGFRIFREYRLLMVTPEIPIRSMPMGLVEIHGKAKIDLPVLSPVTRTPCCFYQVVIDRWVESRGSGRWEYTATDADGPKFYLEDASGKVLVDAHQAEYDLLKMVQVEIWSTQSGCGRKFSGLNGPTRTAMRTLPPEDLFAYASTAVARWHSGGILGLAGGAEEHNHYRLTENLVLPEHWYDLTGTCVENPTPQDEHDRNLIVKGTNEPTFLLTWRSEKEIRRTLRERAAKYIFGGGVLAVACLGIFLAKHGWF